MVATSTAIDDAVATRFAEGFYRGLVGGGSVQRAFDEAVASERATIGDDPGARCVANFRPSRARRAGPGTWPWARAAAPRTCATPLSRRRWKARLVPLLPYACDCHAQEGSCAPT
ncbi:MAG: hypothetical protein R3F60_14650 [bacterium]